MTTRHLVSLVTGVLIVAIFLPILLSIWLAHREADVQFRDEQEHYASRVLARTQQVLEQAKTALRQIDAAKSPSCSPSHLLEMRRISYSWRYIQEVISLHDSTPLCSSLEVKSAPTTYPAPDRITSDGFRTWFTAKNDLGLDRYMIAVASDRHMVIIDPLSFIDVLPSDLNTIQSALLGTIKDRVLASSEPINAAVWKRMKQQGLETLTQDNIVYTVRYYPDLDLAVLTWSSSQPKVASWHRQLAIWLPIGVLMSLLAAGFMLRLLRRLQSPHHRLQDALNEAAITVHYQPIISLKTGKIVGAEALARWRQPDGSYLSPEIFIPLAEQTGLITELTVSVVNNIFHDLGKWLSLHPEVHVSINLSVEDIGSTTLPGVLSRQLNHWQVAPSQIALELTERGFADPTTALPVIAGYRKAGHAIYIDDFGTGYSSLRYLQDLEVDALKIDKSFVDALEHQQVTPYIIEMAKTLKLDIVAEGIETSCQQAWLQQHGVHYGQGWLYSKALPKAEFILWAEENLRTHK